MSEIIQMTDKSFDKVMNDNSLVLVDFWAPWCNPCKSMEKSLEELSVTYKNKIVIAKIDVDENPQTAMNLQIQSVPTLLIYKNSTIINK